MIGSTWGCDWIAVSMHQTHVRVLDVLTACMVCVICCCRPAGPDDVAAARQQAPDSIRAVLGRTAALGSDSPAGAAEDLAFFFGSSTASSNTVGAGSTHGSTGARYGSQHSASRGSAGSASRPASTSSGGCGSAAHGQSCCRGCGTTLGVMLPHAVKDGIAGLLLEEIQGAFQVTGLQQFSLSKQAAAEFLEVSLDC